LADDSSEALEPGLKISDFSAADCLTVLGLQTPPGLSNVSGAFSDADVIATVSANWLSIVSVS